MSKVEILSKIVRGARMSKNRVLIGSPALMRQTNARTILMLLKKLSSCSRADLVRETGMSAPTVANVISDLNDLGLIEWIGEGASSGGRRPDNLRFKADYGGLARFAESNHAETWSAMEEITCNDSRRSRNH